MVATQQLPIVPAQPQLRRVEDFDINATVVCGQVNKVWSKNSHTFLRVAVQNLAIETPVNADETSTEGATKSRPQFTTARIEDGLLNGELVTVMPGDWVKINGYLADMPYDESIREFLDNVKLPKAKRKEATKVSQIIDSFPNKEAWDLTRIKRVNTRLEVTALEIIEDPASRENINFVEVEGVVAQTWRWNGDLYARIAIYDQCTTVTDGVGRNGLPRRKPHYVTIVFLDSKVSNRTITLHERHRVRVRGSVRMHLYSESLREMLVRNGKISLLQAEIPNSDQIGAYRATHSSTYVVATSAQVYAKMSPMPEDGPGD